MDNYNSLEQALLQYKRPAYKNTSGTHINVRCPYCGDSRKNRSSAHFYIKLDSPNLYHCKKCEVGGVVNAQTLRDLEIYSSELAVEIVKNQNEGMKNSGRAPVNINTFSEKDYQIVIYETPLAEKSRKYLEDRVGESISDEFIKQAKIILDPAEFLKRYNFKTYRGFDFDNSVGFISSDNTHLIMRNLNPDAKRRYNNYDLTMASNPYASKIYNIKSQVDLSETKITLVITEGIFDIISVYKHFYEDKDEKSYIFAAATGKGYVSVINKFMRMGFLDLDIELYSDSDVDMEFLRDVKSKYFLTGSNFTVYKNKIGKDFGVPKDQIELTYIKI